MRSCLFFYKQSHALALLVRNGTSDAFQPHGERYFFVVSKIPIEIPKGSSPPQRRSFMYRIYQKSEKYT